MKRIILNLTTALLTFAVGVICASPIIILTSRPPEISLGCRVTRQINLHDEIVLRGHLFQMRKLIDQYTVDQGQAPRSLDELVGRGYLREIPVDPMTGEKNWQPEGIGSPRRDGFHFWVITNIRSKSTATSSEYTLYSEW